MPEQSFEKLRELQFPALAESTMINKKIIKQPTP